jgi:hypothetical protein
MSKGRRAGLLDSRPDQSRPTKACDDRVHLVRVSGIPVPSGADPGNGSLPPLRRPEPRPAALPPPRGGPLLPQIVGRL